MSINVYPKGDEVQALEAELARMQQDASSALESLKADLRTLCRELNGGWPFCTKTKVRNEISTILSHHA